MDIFVLTRTALWLRYVISWNGGGTELVISNQQILDDAGFYIRELFDVSGLDMEGLRDRTAHVMRIGLTPWQEPDAWSAVALLDGEGAPYFVVKKANATPGAALLDLNWVHTIVR